jgi:general secretion pathway protein H
MRSLRSPTSSARAPLGQRAGSALGDAEGFTLIEIIVTMVIVGMAMALVAPAINAGSRARDVRSAVREVTGAMRTMQTEAVRTGRAQSLLVSVDENRLELEGFSRQIAIGDTAALRQVAGGERNSFGFARVRFFPNGSTSGMQLLIGDRDYPAELGYVVSVDPLIGRVTVTDEER